MHAQHACASQHFVTGRQQHQLHWSRRSGQFPAYKQRTRMHLSSTHTCITRNRDPPSGCATRLATNAARRPSAGTICLCSDSGTIRCAVTMLLSRQYFLSDEKEFTIKESRPAYKSLLCPTRSETRVRWRCVGGCKGWLLTPCSWRRWPTRCQVHRVSRCSHRDE